MLSTSGYVLCELGSYPDAEECFVEALSMAKRSGARAGVCYAQQTLGLVRLRRAQPEEAQRVLHESVQGFASLGMRDDEAWSLCYLAAAMAERNDLPVAALAITRALDLVAEPRTRALALATSAALELSTGRKATALRAATEAMELLETHHLFEHVALIRVAHIESLLACDRVEEAQVAASNAHIWLEDRARRIDDADLRASFLTRVPENARIRKLAE